MPAGRALLRAQRQDRLHPETSRLHDHNGRVRRQLSGHASVGVTPANLPKSIDNLRHVAIPCATAHICAGASTSTCPSSRSPGRSMGWRLTGWCHRPAAPAPTPASMAKTICSPRSTPDRRWRSSFQPILPGPTVPGVRFFAADFLLDTPTHTYWCPTAFAASTPPSGSPQPRRRLRPLRQPPHGGGRLG